MNFQGVAQQQHHSLPILSSPELKNRVPCRAVPRTVSGFLSSLPSQSAQGSRCVLAKCFRNSVASAVNFCEVSESPFLVDAPSSRGNGSAGQDEKTREILDGLWEGNVVPTRSWDREQPSDGFESVSAIDQRSQLERDFQLPSPSCSGRGVVDDGLVCSTLGSRKLGRHSTRIGRRGGDAGARKRKGTEIVLWYTKSQEDQLRSLDTDDARFLLKLMKDLEKGRSKFKMPRGSGDSATSAFLGMGEVGLLTKAQEQRLGTILQRGIVPYQMVRQLKTELGRDPTGDEALALANERFGKTSMRDLSRVLVETDVARDLLIQFNTRLVIAVVKSYRNKGIEFKDLIPEGMHGLRKAVEKFDPERGFKFSTYAHWWIRQAVARTISNESRIIRVPVYIGEMGRKISKARESLEGEEWDISNESVAAALNIPTERVSSVLKFTKPIKSLDEPAYSGEQTTVNRLDESAAEFVEEETVTAEAEEVVRRDINTLLSTLPPRERNVLRMRYGLHSPEGRCLTLGDISAAYGLTKERIRQIEEKGLTKLKQPWRLELLRPHLVSPILASADEEEPSLVPCPAL